MAAPIKCPVCNEKDGWLKVDERKKGFSLGKAAVGGFLFGGLGLLGGILGKKRQSYFCKKCGFKHEY